MSDERGSSHQAQLQERKCESESELFEQTVI